MANVRLNNEFADKQTIGKSLLREEVLYRILPKLSRNGPGVIPLE